MAVTISGTTGVGVSTTPIYPSDIAVGTLGTTANSQLVGARLLGVAGTNGDTLEISQLRGTAGTDWTTAGWRLQQRVDGTWMGYIQFNGTASGTNNNGISIGTGSSVVNANTITERLRIDASGNVGIGTGSAGVGYRLHISSPLTGTTTRSNTVLRVQSEATGRDVHIQLSDNITNSAELGMVGGAMYMATAGTERMRIDASGRVTMPAQPAFLANHSLSTATTPSEMIWGNVGINVGSCYNVANGRFTAPVAGTYFFRAHTLTANATAGESRLALYKNGAGYGGAQSILVKVATTWATIMVHSHMYLSAGDYVSVFIVQVAGSLYNDGNYNSFSGHLVG